MRPIKRSDCIGTDRPCPWVGCRWNTALDVSKIGGIVGPRRNGRGLDRSPLRVLPRRWPCVSKQWAKVEQSIIDYLDEIRSSGETNCVLDIIDQGGDAPGSDGLKLVTIGDIMGLTRERVRQIEQEAIVKIADSIQLGFGDVL